MTIHMKMNILPVAEVLLSMWCDVHARSIKRSVQEPAKIQWHWEFSNRGPNLYNMYFKGCETKNFRVKHQ